jgi:hypothetical protein
MDCRETTYCDVEHRGRERRKRKGNGGSQASHNLLHGTVLRFFGTLNIAILVLPKLNVVIRVPEKYLGAPLVDNSLHEAPGIILPPIFAAGTVLPL